MASSEQELRRAESHTVSFSTPQATSIDGAGGEGSGKALGSACSHDQPLNDGASGNSIFYSPRTNTPTPELRSWGSIFTPSGIAQSLDLNQNDWELDPEYDEESDKEETPLSIEEKKVGRFRISTARQGGPPADGSGSAGPPVVAVLLGWLGCRDRHLSKYAHLYHRLGMPVVVRTTVPTLASFDFRHTVQKVVAKQILDLLEEHYPTSRVVMQYYSNGGCFVHWHLHDLVRSGRRPMPNLLATIFDSCPAGAGAGTATRAVVANQRSPLLRVVLGISLRVTLTLWDVVSLNWLERNYIGSLSSDALPVPSLYIFSRDDHITEYELVQKVISKRRELKRSKGLPDDIETWVLESSPHVGHFISQREQYTERLGRFLTKIGAAEAL